MWWVRCVIPFSFILVRILLWESAFFFCAIRPGSDRTPYRVRLLLLARSVLDNAILRSS